MRILVQRYSALGDIMILLPLLQKLKETYPEHEIALCSRPFIRPLAEGIGIKFYAADLANQHKGIQGLSKLAFHIHKDFRPDIIVDAHAVLRSKVINRLFYFLGRKIYSIKKDRNARKQFLHAGADSGFSLEPMYKIHLANFQRAELKIDFNPREIAAAPFELESKTLKWWSENKSQINIGIAPGAQHRSKQWPPERFSAFMKLLNKPGYRFFLFGGKDEIPLLEEIGRSSGVDYSILAGSFSLHQELALMKEFNLFVSHDSSNMHMAAWAQIPLISIWGGTHPGAGFAPYGSKNEVFSLPENSLDCRPCSIYGTSTCKRGDWACMEGLNSADLVRLAKEKL